MPLKRLNRKRLGYMGLRRKPVTRRSKPLYRFRRTLRFNAGLKALQMRQSKRYRRKLRARRRRIKDGFVTHVVKGLSAVKYGNRVTNAENSSTGAVVRQMDSDFALFNFCPYTYDPYSYYTDVLNIGRFHGNTSGNDLNVPNINSGDVYGLKILPSIISASSFWDKDSQINALSECFEEFRIKTAVIEITMPDVMEIPDTNVPTVNNNLFLMWRFNDDIKPPGVRGFLRKHFTDFEDLEAWRKILPFVNAPDLDEINSCCSEEHRNASGSNWHRVRLTPGKAIKIKWHPKTWLRGKSGVMQQDVVVNGTTTKYFSNPVPNPFGRPSSGWVDTDAIQVGDVTGSFSREDDVFFTGPTFLLLDTSHSAFATYNAPELTVQDSVFQSQFKLQCRYYYKLQFRKVRRYDDNNIREGGLEGD